METQQKIKFTTYKKADKILISLAYLSFIVPIIMTLLFWFEWYISIIGISLLGIASYFILRKIKTKTYQEYQSIFNLKKIIIFALVIIGINVLSGAGGLFHQNWDYNFRNGVFQDLIDKDWPVSYDFSEQPEEAEIIGSEKGVSGYYFSYWLPSAAVGKITNFEIGSIFLLIHQTILTGLFFYLLCRFRNQIKIKYFLVFIMFSGLDLITGGITSVMFGTDIELIGTVHIDTINDHYLMSSFITQLFWVFNQSIPAWIAIMLVLNEKDYRKLGIIIALLMPFAPFPTIGLAIYSIVIAVFGFDLNKLITKDRIKLLFSKESVMAVLAVIPIGLLFLQNTNVKGLNIQRAAEEVGLENSLILYLVYLILEFGIYIIILNKENKKKLLVYFLVFAILPLFYFGVGADFYNRVSIPFLILLFIEILIFLDLNKNKVRIKLLWIILLIGSITNFNEIYRSIKFTHFNYKYGYSNVANKFEGFDNFVGGEQEGLIKNFVVPYKEDDFYFKYIYK